jgi:hypothetical protein
VAVVLGSAVWVRPMLSTARSKTLPESKHPNQTVFSQCGVDEGDGLALALWLACPQRGTVDTSDQMVSVVERWRSSWRKERFASLGQWMWWHCGLRLSVWSHDRAGSGDAHLDRCGRDGHAAWIGGARRDGARGPWRRIRFPVRCSCFVGSVGI